MSDGCNIFSFPYETIKGPELLKLISARINNKVCSPTASIPHLSCQGGISPIERVNFTGLCYVDSDTGEETLMISSLVRCAHGL